MSETIYELTFDFINGKTKTFRFNTEKEALFCQYNNITYQKWVSEEADEDKEYTPSSVMYINDTKIFLNHVCSVTYHTYLKSGEDQW